jgi:23S rRNA pseudouridine2604 synthase
MTESVRLSKYLADRFSCSRREAENYVQGGWVRVDGQIIEEPGLRIEPQQKVELATNARSEDHKPVTILLINLRATAPGQGAGRPEDSSPQKTRRRMTVPIGI